MSLKDQLKATPAKQIPVTLSDGTKYIAQAFSAKQRSYIGDLLTSEEEIGQGSRSLKLQITCMIFAIRTENGELAFSDEDFDDLCNLPVSDDLETLMQASLQAAGITPGEEPKKS